jgi:hypothetical protein
MKRRSFLSFLVGLPLVSLLPWVKVPQPTTYGGGVVYGYTNFPPTVQDTILKKSEWIELDLKVLRGASFRLRMWDNLRRFDSKWKFAGAQVWNKMKERL